MLAPSMASWLCATSVAGTTSMSETTIPFVIANLSRGGCEFYAAGGLGAFRPLACLASPPTRRQAGERRSLRLDTGWLARGVSGQGSNAVELLHHSCLIVTGLTRLRSLGCHLRVVDLPHSRTRSYRALVTQ